MEPSHSSRRILLPARMWFIALSLFTALMLNLVPLGRVPGVPDWVALTLAFWCIHQPLKVGMTTAFVMGIAMDVANANVMGQHALAYVLLAFLTGGLAKRVLWFPLSQQALHLFPMLLAAQVIMLIVRMMAGGEFPGILWFFGSVTGALVWHPLTYLLLLPQFQPVERDENRPI